MAQKTTEMNPLIGAYLIVNTLSSIEQNDNDSYSKLLQEIQKKKSEYRTAYANADSAARDSIIKSAGDYLFRTITSGIFPAWYGTPWNFYGATRTPRRGSIACGYFVTTVLEDAGFDIPYIKWAQYPSETFIKKIALRKDIARFSSKPIEDVKDYLLKAGDGLYIVGLDIHVGYILVSKKTLTFIHSSYYHPDIGVMAESFDTDTPLSKSYYRVIGKILSDEMVRNWINGVRYGE